MQEDGEEENAEEEDEEEENAEDENAEEEIAEEEERRRTLVSPMVEEFGYGDAPLPARARLGGGHISSNLAFSHRPSVGPFFCLFPTVFRWVLFFSLK